MYQMEWSRLMTILTLKYLTSVIKISLIFSGWGRRNQTWD